jgi:hypothetical protein
MHGKLRAIITEKIESIQMIVAYASLHTASAQQCTTAPITTVIKGHGRLATFGVSTEVTILNSIVILDIK